MKKKVTILDYEDPNGSFPEDGEIVKDVESNFLTVNPNDIFF